MFENARVVRYLKIFFFLQYYKTPILYLQNCIDKLEIILAPSGTTIIMDAE